MSSWQQYIDTSLVGSRNVDVAAIWSIEGDSAWAQSSNFVLSAAEVKAVIALFKDAGKAYGEGIHIQNKKYLTIKAEDERLYGAKSTGEGTKEGIIIVRATKCVLIAHHPDTIQSANCANTVEVLAKYLKDAGY